VSRRMDWNGRHVWAVGGGSGMGRALALALADRGAVVTASGRRADALHQLATEASTHDARIIPLPLDVGEPSELRAGWERLCAERGAPDVVIYCAGAWEPASPERLDAALDTQVAANFTGLVRVAALAVPAMRERGEGLLVGFSSASALLALPRAEVYGATKSAATYFLRSLRIDLRSSGVRVLTVHPGFVRTPLTERNDFAMPALLKPEQAAAMVLSGIERGQSQVDFPRRLLWPIKLAGALPRPVGEWLVTRIFRR
jgi:NAD(P)-dependent dehydrogenase (short-subunit alcohol dehydrogenase family)